MLVHFLLTPLVVRYLGRDAFGLWSLAFAALGFVGLVEFGFGSAVLRTTARARGDGDLDLRNRSLSTLGVFHLLLGLLALVGVVVLSQLLGSVFGVPSEFQEDAETLVWILGLRLALVATPFSFFRNVLFGEERIGAINVVGSVSIVGYAISVWLALLFGGDVITVAWLNLAFGVLEFGSYAVLGKRLVPSLKLRWRLVDLKLIPELLSFSSASFLISVSALVLLKTDPLVVKLGLPLSAVALYAVALKIVENGHLLVKQVINVLAPRVARLHHAGDEGQLRHIMVELARHTFWAATLLAGAVFVLGEALLIAWMGPEFAPAAPAMSVLMASMTLLVPQMVVANVLMMTGAHAFMAKASLTAVLLNVAVSVALVFRLELLGVALGTLASTVVIDVWLILRYACKRHGLSYPRYLLQVFGPGLLALALQVGLTWLCALLVNPGNLLTVGLVAIPGVLLSVVVYGAGFAPARWRQAVLRRVTKRPTPSAS
jgi:O-antigen/teichoic acid export membrane protein